MDERHLSKRLECAASFVQPNDRLADIGSDHAYLPCALVLNNTISYAVAGEVVLGPYKSAEKQVKKLELTDSIDVRLGDGLDVISESDQLNVITICGMGGRLIASILDNAINKKQLSGKERLILQPNVDEYTLRSWLVANGYIIRNEAIVEEKQKFYEIIVAEKGKNKLVEASEQDLKYGFFLRKNQTTEFKKKWQNQLEKNRIILTRLMKSPDRTSKKTNYFEKEIHEIEELLKNG